jgi:erythrocyte band 7 integral membrane protein
MSDGSTFKRPFSDHEDEHGNVTDERRMQPPLRSGGHNERIITVQPLRREDMQPSYYQDLGTGSVQHGVYGNFINSLGACVGFFGAIVSFCSVLQNFPSAHEPLFLAVLSVAESL